MVYKVGEFNKIHFPARGRILKINSNSGLFYWRASFEGTIGTLISSNSIGDIISWRGDNSSNPYPIGILLDLLEVFDDPDNNWK